MPDTIKDLIFIEIKYGFFSLFAMLVASSIAYFNNYFKLPKNEKINLDFSYLISVFIIFFFVKFVGGSSLLLIWNFLKLNYNTTSFMVFSNLFLDLLLVFFLYILCFRQNSFATKEIIKQKTLNQTSITNDAVVGILSWLIAFPLVSFFSSFFNIFTMFFFHIQKVPDQLAVYFVKSTLHHPFLFIIGIIMIIFIGPFFEEFIFRGVVQSYLKKFFKRSLAIFLSSFIFAIFHFSFFQKLANINILGSVFVLGCFLGFLYEKQKSLISPFFLHATFNAVTILQILFTKDV